MWSQRNNKNNTETTQTKALRIHIIEKQPEAEREAKRFTDFEFFSVQLVISVYDVESYLLKKCLSTSSVQSKAKERCAGYSGPELKWEQLFIGVHHGDGRKNQRGKTLSRKNWSCSSGYPSSADASLSEGLLHSNNMVFYIYKGIINLHLFHELLYQNSLHYTTRLHSLFIHNWFCFSFLCQFLVAKQKKQCLTMVMSHDLMSMTHQ